MKNIIKNKKGQALSEALLTGFVIVAAVLFLVVLIVFIFGIIATSLETTKDSYTVTNETTVAFNASGSTLAIGIGGDPRDFSISAARNGTNGVVIAAGNYTLNAATGVVRNATAVVWPVVHLDYSYNNDSIEITGAYTAQTNTTRSIPLIGILFIVLAVGAIVTILVISLLGRRTA